MMPREWGARCVLALPAARDSECGGDGERDGGRRPMALSTASDGRHVAAVCTGRRQLDVVSWTTDTDVQTAAVALPQDVVAVALSACGRFVAVADARGRLHLVTRSGQTLLAYPVSDEPIEAVAFAATNDTLQDLLVLTASGLLLRLGNLALPLLEQSVSQEEALQALAASVRLERVHVGRKRDGERSRIVARRYPTALYVIVANHEHVLSVWRSRVASSSGMERVAAYPTLPGNELVRDMRLVENGRQLAVLSSVSGTLSCIEWDRDGHGQQALKSFVKWVLQRVEVTAKNEDVDTALQFISLIQTRSNDAEVDLNVGFQWTAARLQSNRESEDNASISVMLERLDSMSRHLEEIKYLKTRHSFNISLSMFSEIAFLHQCVELEGNARWWHYFNLLGIQCDHKAFQSERRDLNYIRQLVPTLLVKSNFDYYTILEFTRHYQIDDSYAALVH
ncbi:hypothetical protein P43SY_010560 [Pythium insidiosum]|uniref:Uncharacterized protein n=1 Tax=Pythium insidiosum TaxID=114742 RepID=A0AAD5Q5W4_PYTIN|nr:hypothetical protein P43SY_010560 [Pythium insidiosum]